MKNAATNKVPQVSCAQKTSSAPSMRIKNLISWTLSGTGKVRTTASKPNSSTSASSIE